MHKQPIHAVTLTASHVHTIEPFMYAYVHRATLDNDKHYVKRYQVQTAHRLARVHLLQSLLMKG